jgi:hypothetical protein
MSFSTWSFRSGLAGTSRFVAILATREYFIEVILAPIRSGFGRGRIRTTSYPSMSS